jgi:DNA modification methylase
VTETATPLTRHPAKFSDPIIDALRVLVRGEQQAWGEMIHVLDPFAGVGRIHRLYEPGKIETWGIEIEPEWAACHSRTTCGDSLLAMEQGPRVGDAPGYHVIATSPCYANRFKDSYNAQDGSVRRSYHFDLGRRPSEGSNATFGWEPKYWAFMARAYRAMYGTLRPGGTLLLNVSDFRSNNQMVHAVVWHDGACWGAGFTRKHKPIRVKTRRLRYGENADARADHEVILVYRKADVPPEEA